MLSFAFIGVYIKIFKDYAWLEAYKTSGCVGIALCVSMVISSFSGTIIPLIFKKLKVDPAVASGPMITTINDLVAVVTYYGLAWLLLLKI